VNQLGPGQFTEDAPHAVRGRRHRPQLVGEIIRIEDQPREVQQRVRDVVPRAGDDGRGEVLPRDGGLVLPLLVGIQAAPLEGPALDRRRDAVHAPPAGRDQVGLPDGDQTMVDAQPRTFLQAAVEDQR